MVQILITTRHLFQFISTDLCAHLSSHNATIFCTGSIFCVVISRIYPTACRAKWWTNTKNDNLTTQGFIHNCVYSRAITLASSRDKSQQNLDDTRVSRAFYIPISKQRPLWRRPRMMHYSLGPNIFAITSTRRLATLNADFFKVLTCTKVFLTTRNVFKNVRQLTDIYKQVSMVTGVGCQGITKAVGTLQLVKWQRGWWT